MHIYTLAACMFVSLHTCVCPCMHVDLLHFAQSSDVQLHLHVPDALLSATATWAVTADTTALLGAQADRHTSTWAHARLLSMHRPRVCSSHERLLTSSATTVRCLNVPTCLP
ncbi:hypothetical protein ABBQ32_009059 [Trebouxia sp. C0010 RCD-2024]